MESLSTVTRAQLWLWCAFGVVFMWLGFRPGKRWYWRALGVVGFLNLSLSLGELARRTGGPPTP